MSEKDAFRHHLAEVSERDQAYLVQTIAEALGSERAVYVAGSQDAETRRELALIIADALHESGVRLG